MGKLVKKYIKLFDAVKTESDTHAILELSARHPSLPQGLIWCVLFIGAKLYAMRWLYMLDMFKDFE